MTEAIARCDNKSVGVVVSDAEGRLALLKRARFPVGFAPPAGHVDEHGSPEKTGVEEVGEELGLAISVGGLKRTAIAERRVNNQCRRPGGDHHVWTVFETDQFEGELQPDADETEGADWYPKVQVQELADRTRAFQAGHIPQADWEAHPGLEGVWVEFLSELGYID